MLQELIPLIQLKKANKKLQEKIENCEIETPDELKQIETKYLIEDYRDSIEIKNRLEDKAKTIIMALTISVTLILNLSSVIETISNKFNSHTTDILIFTLAILAIIYMLFAGIMSIHILIKENVSFPLSAEAKTEQDKKEIYITTQMNINQNLIRNNIIFASYRSIRNSVVCLVVLFVIAICPSYKKSASMDANADVLKGTNICFEMDAVTWLNENNNKKIVFDNIVEQYNKDNSNNKIRNIYDKENKLLVSIKMEGNVYVIENIISEIEEISQ